MPGTSGQISQFCDLKSFYFDDSPEPDRFYYDSVMELKKKAEAEGRHWIGITFDNPEDFYAALVSMEKFTNDNIQISGTSKEGSYDMVVSDAVDLDDEKAPSIDRDAKKKTKAEKEEAAKQKAKDAEMMMELEKELYENEDYSIDD
jgi:hypothetical protein